MSKFDELKKLDELLKDGAITQKEFDQQKEKLLGTKTSSMKLKDISSMKLKDISSMKLKDLILKPSKWFLNWFLGLDKKSKIIVVILLLIITIQTFPEESSTDIVAEQETTTTTQLQETTTTTQLQETTTTTQLQETINTQCDCKKQLILSVLNGIKLLNQTILKWLNCLRPMLTKLKII